MITDLFAVGNYALEVRPKLDFFLFCDFPIVRKNFSEELYLVFMTKGEDVFGAEACDELSEFLSNAEVQLEVEQLKLFKNRWDDINAKLASP